MSNYYLKINQTCKDNNIITPQILSLEVAYQNYQNIIHLNLIKYEQIESIYQYLLCGKIKIGINNVAFDVCYTNDESTSFIVTPYGIVVIPLRSTLVFHTDIIWLKDIPNSSIKKKILMTPSGNTNNSNNQIQVGMNVQLQLSQIYANNAVLLKTAYYYNNFEMKDLPWWIQLSQDSLSVSLTVNKEALDQQQIQELVNSQTLSQQEKVIVSQQKQIIFVLSERIVTSDFIQDQIPISSTLSLQIYTDCLKKQILNEAGFLNDNMGVSYLSEIFKDSNYDLQVLEQIKFILRSKITYYPVSFTIQNSLFINIMSKERIVDSFSQSVQVYFKIDSNKASFINRNYPGVLTSFSDKRDQVKIEGELGAVNKVLKDGIKIANLTDTNQVSIIIEVNDGVNYNLQKAFNLGESLKLQSTIMSLNQPTYVNPDFSLQKDFNRKFSSAEIGILEKFQYQIGSMIFLDDDSTNLKVNALIQSSNGTYIEIGSNSWLTYDSNQMIFQGTPPSSLWRTTLSIKVIASDDYTFAEDYLTIKIETIPFQIIVTILFQILGPIIGIFGLWKYSSSIYNICYRKNHETTCMIANVSEVFQLQIPLIKDELILARQIWLQYFKQIDKDEILLKLNHQKKLYSDKRLQEKKWQEKSIEQQPLYFQQQEADKQFARIQFSPLLRKVSQNKSGMMNSQDFIKQNQSYQYITYENKFKSQTSGMIDAKENKPQNEATNSHEKINSELEKKTQERKFSKVMRQVNKLECDQIKRTRTISAKMKFEKREYENSFFKPDGHINGQFIIEQVKQFYVKSKINSQNLKIIEDLSNLNSKLSRCIIGLATVSLAKFDQSSNKIIEYLKNQSQILYTQQDWYRKYVIITPCFESILEQPFPNIIINDDIFQMELNMYNSLKQDCQSQLPYYLPLVEDCLISMAHGFIFESHLFIPQPRGESLEMSPQSLKCIESYTPTLQKSFPYLRKVFDMDFVQKELSENTKLNSWVHKVEVLNNVILIEGTPQQQDAGLYLLKIRDQYGYTIKRINIIIKPKRNQSNQQNKSNTIACSTENIFSNKTLLSPQIKYNSNQNEFVTSPQQIDTIALEMEENNIKQAPRFNFRTHKNSYNTEGYPIMNIKEDNQLF